MKLFAALSGVAGLFAAIFIRPVQEPMVKVVILGNHQGYLSPCGCSSPMLGGILRQASVVRSIRKRASTVVIDSGNISGGDSEQEILKAQTLVETLRSLQTAAINLTFEDSKFGVGELNSIQALSGDAVLSGSIEKPPNLSIEPFKESEGFLIGGVSSNGPNLAKQLNGQSIDPKDAAQRLLAEAQSRRLKSILMLDGSKEDAVSLARTFPQLTLIVFNSASKPPTEPMKVGETLLVSPGERGEYLLELTYRGDAKPNYSAITLGENVTDDPEAHRFYKTYLNRVEDHHLWQKMPRRRGNPFAGSAACSNCHAQDYRIWKSSDHAKALKTLSKVGHDRDPECLKCHVTGADVKTGFRTLQTTPHLGVVGCESCHGPAAKHALNPYAFRLPKVAVSCVSCHEALNSPNFDFATYWPKIKHGPKKSSAVEKGWKAKN